MMTTFWTPNADAIIMPAAVLALAQTMIDGFFIYLCSRTRTVCGMNNGNSNKFSLGTVSATLPGTVNSKLPEYASALRSRA